jgi:tetratricopeptide (TPR) repeat protein
MGRAMTSENSVTENSVKDEKLNAALESLNAARELQKLRRSHGVDRIHLLVDGVEGDWLEQWADDEILDSEEFQDKLNFLAATARREEFQKKIQSIEERIAETNQEIQELSDKIRQHIKRAYQDLPDAIPAQRFVVQSHESASEPPPSLVKNVDRIIALSPLVIFEPTAEDYFRLGNARFLENLCEGAVNDYDKALKLKSDFVEALCNKGAALAQLHRYKEAVLILDEAVRINPDFANAWHNRGIALAKMKNYSEANESYLKALELQPESVETYLSMGNSLFCAERYLDALQTNEKLLEINPNYYEAWNNRGTVLKQLGKSEEAIASFNQALKINPGYAQALYNKGNAFYGCENYKEAISCYEQALQLSPEFYEAWVNKGNALSYLDRDEEAIANFEKVITASNASTFSDLHKAWSGMGRSLGKLGQNVEAIEAYRKIFELQPNDAQAWHGVGVGLGTLEQYLEAEVALEKAIELQPDNAVISFHLGVIKTEIGNFNEARQLYEKSVYLNPSHLEAWESLGILLHQKFKDYKGAIGYYNKAIELKPAASTFFNRACALSLLRENNSAIEDLQKAIKLDPKFREQTKTDSDFDSIRNDDRFQQLLASENEN